MAMWRPPSAKVTPVYGYLLDAVSRSLVTRSRLPSISWLPRSFGLGGSVLWMSVIASSCTSNTALTPFNTLHDGRCGSPSVVKRPIID